MTPTKVVDLLEQRLRSLGVERVYGERLGALDHVGIDDQELCALLADADGRLGHHDGSGRLGAAFLEGGILHLSSRPGGTAAPETVRDAGELLRALVDVPGIETPATTALHLDLDLDEPVPADLSEVGDGVRQPVLTLDPALASLDIVIVVGPGVVRAGAVDALGELARRGGIGVLNTWGAKGVERWDSPFHFGTIGLQALDADLAELGTRAIVLTSGLDPDELGSDALSDLVVQDVAPRQLGALCHAWDPSRQAPRRPPLYDTIAAVTTPMYESDAVPLSGPRAALHLSGALPDRGVVVADAGASGFWIARTLPTSFPGSVCVPAVRVEGFAAAAAFVCGLETRSCVAVTDQVGVDGVDPVTDALLEVAEAMEVPVSMQLWGAGGSLASSTSHVEMLAATFGSDNGRIDDVPVDTHATDELERVAGPIVAW